MIKKILGLGIIFTMAISFCLSQKLESLRVTSSKIANDTVTSYEIIIVNYSDSIAVLPHSVFFDINEIDNNPIGLALYDSRQGIDFYSLNYAWGDTLIDPQKYPFTADYLLPRQKLEFKIATKPICHHCTLIISYFFLYNIDYRAFPKSINNSWQQTFSLKSVNVILDK